MVYTVWDLEKAKLIDQINVSCGLTHFELTKRFRAIYGSKIWVNPSPTQPSKVVPLRKFI